MYCDRDDILNRITYADLVQLTNDEPTAKLIDEDKLSGIISLANTIVDSYLRGRYDLPLAIADEDLTDIACSLAIFKIYELRYRNLMPDSIQRSWEQAISRLKDYQSGKKKLDTGTIASRPSYIRTNSRTQKFTSDLLEMMP